MTANPADSTSKELATKCNSIGHDHCFNNIRTIIRGWATTPNGWATPPKPDFMCFQEATRMNVDFFDGMGYGVIGHSTDIIKNRKVIGKADIVTIFDNTKWQYIKHAGGELDSISGGRPFIIAFFINSQSNQKIIVVNCHFPQPDNIDEFEPENSIPHVLDKTFTELEIDVTWRNAPIILGGDLNDREYKYWENGLPEKEYDDDYNAVWIEKTVYGKQFRASTAPTSCCTGYRSVRTSKHNTDVNTGDYFMSSTGNITNERIPIDHDVLTSDHLPVLATVQFDEQVDEQVGKLVAWQNKSDGTSVKDTKPVKGTKSVKGTKPVKCKIRRKTIGGKTKSKKRKTKKRKIE